MDQPFWKRHLPALLAFAATLMAVALCLPPVATPFFLVDDPIYVRDNTALQQVPMAELWRVFTERTNPWEYLPLRDLSYRIDLALFGLHATGFRLHNALLYALSCLAAWGCAIGMARLLRPASPPRDHAWFAALATAFFALHPAHVESVAWVSGRKDLLSGFFALVSLALFVSALENRCRIGRLLGAYVAFAAAILSKSTVVPLPLAALLLALTAEGTIRFTPKSILRTVAITAPLFALAAVSVVLQMKFGAAATGTDSVDITGAARDLPTRLMLAMKILGALGRTAVCPTSLSLVYDVEAPGLPAVLGMTFGVLAVLASAAGAWFGLFRGSLAGLGLGLAGLFTLPFLQLIPFSTWSYASDRFLFLPVFGVACAVAAIVPGNRRAVVVLPLLVLGGLTLARSIEWRDGRGLIAQAGLRAPTHPIAGRLALHHVFMAADRFDDARAAVQKIRVPSERAVLMDYIDAKEAMKRGDRERLRPLVQKLAPYTPKEDAIARREVANMAQEAGLFALAEDNYRGLLRDYPDSAEIHYNLGLALAKQRRHAEAAVEMQRGIDGGHVDGNVWNNLALSLRDAGQPDRAIEAFRSALKADPAYWHPAYNLARLLILRNDLPGAREALKTARERAQRKGDATTPIDELERAIAAP